MSDPGFFSRAAGFIEIAIFNTKDTKDAKVSKARKRDVDAAGQRLSLAPSSLVSLVSFVFKSSGRGRAPASPAREPA